MIILVLNSGSSSLKFQVINVHTKEVLIKGNAKGIGLHSSKIVYEFKGKKAEKQLEIKDRNQAVKIMFDLLGKNIDINQIKAIGHRVVHGGEFYSKAVLIDDKVISKIKELSSLAPLHNPANLEGIIACKKIMPSIKQVAVFDTAFHQTIPEKAYLYAIPYKYYQKYKIRKYGFHGTSHEYVIGEAIKLLKKKNSKIICCHLGNGSSITASINGKSADTSMGFTPLQGLIMGTRSGDLDPEIISYLCEHENLSVKQVLNILNKESGLKGVCEDSDMRHIHEKREKSKIHQLAFDMLVHRIIFYIGAYFGVLSGVDALVFTAGIGQKDEFVREKVCAGLTNLGVKIDPAKNLKNKFVDITSKSSKIKVFVIPTNEEYAIAKETELLVKK